MKRISRWINALGFASVAVAAIYLMVHYSSYVYKFHALSMFDGSWSWFAGLFDRPAAGLMWCGRLLTQMCFKPALAIPALVMILAAAVWLIRRFIVRDWRFGALSVLPAILVLLFVMRLGYHIFTFRADALIFTQPLGLLCATGLFAWLSTSRRPLALAAAISAVAYPLLGFFGIFPLLMYACWGPLHLEGRKKLVYPIVCLVLSASVPWLWYVCAFDGVDISYLWLQGLPYPDLDGRILVAWPLLAALALTLVLCIFPMRRDSERAVWLAPAVALPVFVSAIAAIYVLPYRDSLFHRQLTAERCIESGDWDGVLRQTAPPSVTNDVLIAYRNIALFRKGQLVEKCCSYPFQRVPITVDGSAMVSSRIAGPTIFYHSGLSNFAARWAFELNLGNSYGLERMKYLAKAALLNGEYALASKYIDAIGRNPFQGRWARKYAQFALAPESMATDPEFSMLMPLRRFKQEFWIPSDKAAYTVPVFYLYMDQASDTPEFLEWCMASAMTEKANNHFEDLYARYATAHKDVPRVVKETRYIFAIEGSDPQRIADVRADFGADDDVIRDVEKIANDRMLNRPLSIDPLSYAHYFYQVQYIAPF